VCRPLNGLLYQLQTVDEWNENWQGTPRYSVKTCPLANLFTTNPTGLQVDLKQGHRFGKPATNRLSFGMADMLVYFTFSFIILFMPFHYNFQLVYTHVCVQHFIISGRHNLFISTNFNYGHEQNLLNILVFGN
jgi:hypothetical protein